MKIAKTSTDDLNAVVTITVEKSDYEATVNETLKEYRKKANMPGFRKGMVPAGLIKKMYGKAALADEVNKILSRELTNYIIGENLNVLGEPLPSLTEQKTIDFDTDEAFEFAFDMGLAPEIVIGYDQVGKLPYYEVEISDALIDSQIDAYTNRFGSSVPAEIVDEKSTVIGAFVQLDADGNELEDGVKVSATRVLPSLMKDEASKNALLSAKIGDTIAFNPQIAFGEGSDVAHMLRLKNEEAEKANATYNFTIESIESFVPAELNEELFKKVYGEEANISTIDEFRAQIRKELKEGMASSENYRFMIDAKARLTSLLDLKLPEAFLKRWLLATNEKITSEQLDEQFSDFISDLQWTLIKNKIAKEFELKYQEEDVLALAKEMAVMQFRQYGMANVPAEYIDNYANSILQNKEQKQRLAEKRVEDMVLELLKEKCGTELKSVTQSEFDGLFEEK